MRFVGLECQAAAVAQVGSLGIQRRPGLVDLPRRDLRRTRNRWVALDKVTGPLGPRRSIAIALRQELREGSGKLLNDVAADLMISTSKLSRLENAQGKPLPRDIRDLIAYYHIEGTPLAGRLQRWVAAAERTGWWADIDAVKEGLDAHVSYEADATVERAYTLPLVQALLQTTDYAQAIFRDMEHRPETEVRELVAEVRIRRQEALSHREGLDPLRLVAVTHESALRQAVGSPQILRDRWTRWLSGRRPRTSVCTSCRSPLGRCLR